MRRGPWALVSGVAVPLLDQTREGVKAWLDPGAERVPD